MVFLMEFKIGPPNYWRTIIILDFIYIVLLCVMTFALVLEPRLSRVDDPGHAPAVPPLRGCARGWDAQHLLPPTPEAFFVVD